jgi:tetratricopeptide (TPR) repeat protein
MSDTYSTKAKLLFSILILFVVIFIAYANTLFSPFNFDDQSLLQQTVFNYPGLYHKIWPIQYRHIFYLSFSLNHSLSGMNTLSYHLTNLLFHFLSSVTVLLIVFKTLKKGTQWESKAALSLSVTTALLFALNPLHTEAITYISGRASGIGGFFYLLALLCFILGSERGRSLSTPLFYTLALLAFGLAILTKETMLTFPLVVILYDLCFMRNGHWHPFKGRLFFIYLPLCCLVGIFLFFAPVIRIMAVEWLGKIDINYAFTQGTILAYALKLCFFPISLTFDYHFPTHWTSQNFFSFIPIVVWLAAIFTTIKNFRRISPVVTFSLLWFLITVSPTNSFLPRADLLSERNLYLPSLGPTFLIAYAFYHLLFIKPKVSPSKQGMALLITFFLVVGSLLITRNSDYRSNIHLWEDTYKKSPADLKVLHNLSHFYLEDNRYQQALVPLLRLSRSGASDFYRAFAHSNLGSIYTQNGNLERAKKEFHKAIELEPTLPLGYLNLGSLYASRGEFHQARTEFLRALERYTLYKWGYPVPWELYLSLARVNFELKSYSAAKKFISTYVAWNRQSMDGLFLKGQINLAMGNIKRAKGAYQTILLLAEQPEINVLKGALVSAKANNNLGILYIKINEYESARDAFNASIKFYPQIPDAHYNLGKLILDLKGDPDLANHHLKLALTYSQSPSLRKEINRLLE